MKVPRYAFAKYITKHAVPLLILSVVVNIVFVTNSLVSQKKGQTLAKRTTNVTVASKDPLFDEINPAKGYEINASFGKLGPDMLTAGVIDYDKFKSTYQRSGQTFPKEFDDILKNGSDKKIKITTENSYFLLNFFWAVGLANKSTILDQGDISTYGGGGQAGNFASTGGWTLAKTQAMDYFSKSNLIPLTPDQESLVKKVSANVFRPCCDNPTSFPDCNHGMALLGVYELMAANGATEAQMYDAGKYFNAFWFPGNYYDLALYFKNKENRSFKDIPGSVILGKDFSSASGYQVAKAWLTEKGFVKAPPKQGGGCGV